jgi:hypothetical protein
MIANMTTSQNWEKKNIRVGIVSNIYILHLEPNLSKCALQIDDALVWM